MVIENSIFKQALIQRRWMPGDWQKFYLTNPVMCVYAAKLLWDSITMKEGC